MINSLKTNFQAGFQHNFACFHSKFALSNILYIVLEISYMWQNTEIIKKEQFSIIIFQDSWLNSSFNRNFHFFWNFTWNVFGSRAPEMFLFCLFLIEYYLYIYSGCIYEKLWKSVENCVVERILNENGQNCAGGQPEKCLKNHKN